MGDFAGHPFRGNQWTAESVTEAQAPGTGDQTPYDLQQKLNEEKANLSVEARATLDLYHTSYSVLNENLRTGKTPLLTTGLLDKTFEKEGLKVKKPTSVYRGVYGSALQDLKPGDVITDKGFVSTTLDPDTARDYSGALTQKLLKRDEDQDVKVTLVRIKLPRGTRYLPGAAGHTEMILQRDSRFKVVNSGRDRKGRMALDLELVK